MWERLRLGELEQTHTNVQTHSHTLPSVMKMKSTGGLEKHVHHQDCSRLWELNLRDRIPRFSWQIVNPVTPTTVRQIKGKRGGLAVETLWIIQYEITPRHEETHMIRY